jgi:hypothetical protein
MRRTGARRNAQRLGQRGELMLERYVYCVAVTSLAFAIASPAYAQVTDPFQAFERLTIHAVDNNTPPAPPVPGAPPAFKDAGHAGMLALGFTQADVDALRSECKAYFRDWYNIDFDLPGTLHLADGTIVGAGSSAGALMFGEYVPPTHDERVVIDSDKASLDNSERKSFIVKDTGCAMVVSVGGGTYGGINAAMPRTAGDVMVYGYANVFRPGMPLHKDNLVERIKFKPAWPIRIVPASSAFTPPGLPMPTEAVFKVEAEYVDKRGNVHYGVGLSVFAQYWDQSGVYHESRRTAYTFP